MINYNLLKTLNVLYLQSEQNIKNDFMKMTNGLFNNIIYAKNSEDIINTYIENKSTSLFIDIVISDIEIPDVDCIEILKIIREKDFDVPIILITNNSQAEIILEAFEYKVSDYLPRTVRKKEFIDSIQKVCQSRYANKFKKEMEENLEELVRAINDVALVSKTCLNGNITFANKLFCETTGFTESELLGQTHDLINDNKTDLIEEKEIWNQLKQGKVWEGIKRCVSKTNEVFFGYLSVIPIFNPLDNNVNEYMWISFLSTEEELEQSEFKKKVAQSINSSRRINTEARDEIDRLFKELEQRKNNELIKYSLIEEKRKTFKLKNEISSYKRELENKEKQIIKSIQKEELDLKNKDMDYLMDELDKQIMIIEELQDTKKREETKIALI